MVTFLAIMFTSDVIEHFGSAQAIAEALGISRQAVGQWRELVPPLSATRIEKISNGELAFDPDVYADWNNRTKSA